MLDQRKALVLHLSTSGSRRGLVFSFHYPLWVSFATSERSVVSLPQDVDKDRTASPDRQMTSELRHSVPLMAAASKRCLETKHSWVPNQTAHICFGLIFQTRENTYQNQLVLIIYSPRRIHIKAHKHIIQLRVFTVQIEMFSVPVLNPILVSVSSICQRVFSTVCGRVRECICLYELGGQRARERESQRTLPSIMCFCGFCSYNTNRSPTVLVFSLEIQMLII